MTILVISCDFQAVVYPIIVPKNIILLHSEFCDTVTMELISTIHPATDYFGTSASLAKHIYFPDEISSLTVCSHLLMSLCCSLDCIVQFSLLSFFP